jgi:hypothetical protein
MKPVQIAKMYYDFFSEVLFEDDLSEYLLNGVVVARPTCFGMARLCDLRPLDAEGNPIGEEPEIAWFVRFATGNLLELLSLLPGFLPKIVFCRNRIGQPKDERLRVYRLDRLCKLAAARAKKGKEL